MDDDAAGAGPGEIMTVAQAAEFLSVAPQTVRNELRAGRLPGKRVGKEWRLSRSALLAWFATPEDELDRYARHTRRTYPAAAEQPAGYDPRPR